MRRKMFSRKLLKNKKQETRTRIRIKKRKTKIMRGGGGREECIDYLKILMEYSKIKLVKFSSLIKEDLQDEDFYDSKPLSEKIDELIKKIDQLIGSSYTLDIMNDVVAECRNVLNLLLEIRQKSVIFNSIIEKYIITSIKLFIEIIFGLESMIQISDNMENDCIIYFTKKMDNLISDYFHKAAEYNRAYYFIGLLYAVYRDHGGNEIGTNITNICQELNTAIHNKTRDYNSIKILADWLLRDVSVTIVYIRNIKHKDTDLADLDKLDELDDLIKEFMSYITQIILISEIIGQGIEKSKEIIQGLILKAKEKAKARAATRIQAHTRSRRDQKSYRTATMSRAKAKAKAATIMQAHHRGNIGRRDATSRRDALIAHEFKLQAEIEKALQEELQAMEAMQ